jgi:hypothetical protein
MPAVRNFSVCAATAVLLDFILQVGLDVLLSASQSKANQTPSPSTRRTPDNKPQPFNQLKTQITVFVALLALDTRRIEQRRLDCFPCLRVPYLDDNGHWVHDALDSDDGDDLGQSAPGWGQEGDAYFAPQPLLGDDGEAMGGGGGGGGGGVGGGRRGSRRGQPGGIHGALHERRLSLGSLLQSYMERVHAPLLMKPLVQAVVVAVFVTGAYGDIKWWREGGARGSEAVDCFNGLALTLFKPSVLYPTASLGLFLSAAAIPRLSVGLDQAVALPRDSYLQVGLCWFLFDCVLFSDQTNVSRPHPPRSLPDPPFKPTLPPHRPTPKPAILPQPLLQPARGPSPLFCRKRSERHRRRRAAGQDLLCGRVPKGFIDVKGGWVGLDADFWCRCFCLVGVLNDLVTALSLKISSNPPPIKNPGVRGGARTRDLLHRIPRRLLDRRLLLLALPGAAKVLPPARGRLPFHPRHRRPALPAAGPAALQLQFDGLRGLRGLLFGAAGGAAAAGRDSGVPALVSFGRLVKGGGCDRVA